MHGYCSLCIPIILLISHFAPFFLSILCAKQTNFSPHPLFPQIHTNTNTPTHKHKHNTHKQINIEIRKHTKWTNQQRDRLVLVLVACGSVDR